MAGILNTLSAALGQLIGKLRCQPQDSSAWAALCHMQAILQSRTRTRTEAEVNLLEPTSHTLQIDHRSFGAELIARPGSCTGDFPFQIP